jgi:hypothetical protein
VTDLKRHWLSLLPASYFKNTTVLEAINSRTVVPFGISWRDSQGSPGALCNQLGASGIRVRIIECSRSRTLKITEKVQANEGSSTLLTGSCPAEI